MFFIENGMLFNLESNEIQIKNLFFKNNQISSNFLNLF